LNLTEKATTLILSKRYLLCSSSNIYRLKNSPNLVTILREFLLYIPKFWESGALVREGLVVDDVPVEDVEFVGFHAVDQLKNGGQRQKMATGVDQKASVRKARVIRNHAAVHVQLKGSIRNRVQIDMMGRNLVALTAVPSREGATSCTNVSSPLRIPHTVWLTSLPPLGTSGLSMRSSSDFREAII